MALQLVTKPHPLEWTFSDRIRKLRKATGLGQAEFAERIGVAPGTYSGWEASPTQPRGIVEVAQRIQHEFGEQYGATANWVLGLENGTGRTPDGGPAGSAYAPRDSNPEPADFEGEQLALVHTLPLPQRPVDRIPDTELPAAA